MGFSDIMRAKMFGELPGRYVEYADLIYESGAHLLDLINDVLDMSKIEAQKFELSREEFDSREPISGALRIVRLQADEAGVQLRGVLPPQPLTVNADKRALKQIVLNLVSNALKFTPRGGSVVVTLGGHGDDMELTVADTGVGIAEEDLAKIGRPYEQDGANDKRVMGTGLGLSLVRAFAELHGGMMTIESRLGAGTAVSVRLPVVIPTPPVEVGGNVVAFSPQR
jgi:cell cycle sensor histidine kinase DivJ